VLSPKALIVLLAAATALALFSTVQAAAYLSHSGEPIPWEELAGWGLALGLMLGAANSGSASRLNPALRQADGLLCDRPPTSAHPSDFLLLVTIRKRKPNYSSGNHNVRAYVDDTSLTPSVSVGQH
jgi:hypothetical protein